MSNLPAYDFTIYYVSDLEASLEFFVKLGFQNLEDQAGPGFHQLRGKEGSPDLGLVQVTAETPFAGTIQPYYKTADLEKSREAILGNGLEAGPVVEMPFGTIFTVKSPDGNTITMMAA